MTELEQLKKENLHLKIQLKATESSLVHYKDEVSRLNDIVSKFKRFIYGSKSERVVDLEPNQLVFNDPEINKETPSPPETEKITYTRNKGRKKKEGFPEGLDRELVDVELPEAERVCPHHGIPLKEIGFEEGEKLVVKPAQMIVRVERVKKYVSTCCESAPQKAKSNSILPGTIATPELLSFIVFSKYFQALTLRIFFIERKCCLSGNLNQLIAAIALARKDSIYHFAGGNSQIRIVRTDSKGGAQPHQSRISSHKHNSMFAREIGKQLEILPIIKWVWHHVDGIRSSLDPFKGVLK